MKKNIFTIACCWVSLTSAVNYFVSPDGSNSAAGTTTAEAWQTIQYALNSVSPGDTIFLMQGTYYEQTEWTISGEDENYITLTRFAEDTVIIDGTDIGNETELMFLQNMKYIRIEGLQFTNHNGSYQPVINCYGKNNHIEIKNCKFYGTDCNESYAILVEGSGDDFVIKENEIFDMTGTNAIGIVFLGTNETSPLTNILITQNYIHNIEPAPSEAIAVNGNVDGFEISYNTVEYVNNIGIDMIGGESWVNTDASVNYARNGVCKWNTIRHANSIYGGGFSAGVYVDGGKNIVVENNTVSYSDIGLEIGCENAGYVTENISVRNNVLFKNDKSGLGFGGYYYPVTGTVSNCSFTGNTIYDSDSLLSGFGQLWIQHATNCVVKNNIFYAKNSLSVVNAYDWNITDLGNILDYNLYYSEGADEYFFDGNFVTGYTSYVSLSGQEEHSIFADPVFLNAEAGDLHLNVLLSPAWNAGDSMFSADGDEVDIDGLLRIADGRVDIGADEAEYPVEIISQPPQENFHLQPNPVFEKIYFEGIEDAVQAEIFDAKGCLTTSLIPGKNNAIDVSFLNPGLYIIKLQTQFAWYASTFQKL